jgi:glycosyltransferase involved in cell wall biosynthesis
MPIVSIVIPTAGRPQLVLAAARSVLAQTVTDIELIVVVDGPDPDTEAALATLADSRLHVLRNPASVGPGQSRNAGIAAARGDWVAFLDDDDEWLSEKLARQLDAAPPGPALLMTLSTAITPTGRYVWPRRVYDEAQPVDEYLFDRRSWFKGDGFVQASSLMVRRALAVELGFAAIKQHEDWEFVIRAVKQHGCRLVTVAEPLVLHLAEHSNRQSASRRYDWRNSLAWIESLGGLITKRAFSGFCLTILAPQPARQGEYAAFPVLLARALRHGSPTLRQLVVFFVFWALPMGLRQRLRSMVRRLKGSRAAS